MSNNRTGRSVVGSSSFFGLPLMGEDGEYRIRSQYNPISSNGFQVILEHEKPTTGDGGRSLTSCTESLGFESSDEVIVSSVPSTSSSSVGSIRRREKRIDRRKFPPPLTSLSENGRRNFTLKSERIDGRLEIVGVMIQRPEILCASRQNGRLRLHLVQTAFDDDDDKGVDENEHLGEGEGEAAEVTEVVDEAEDEEEREWRVVTNGLGLRRCYQKNETQVWGPPQPQFFVM